MDEQSDGKVHVRTPTYRRPEQLKRALNSLIAQQWTNWVCDVYDDDPDQSARIVVKELNDPRIHYNHNKKQKFASSNIDGCFSAANPHDADYFCVVEDDNFILPGFFDQNIALCRDQRVEVVLRNQVIERKSGTPDASLSSNGVLDRLFVEGLYEPARFRMSLLIGIGVSNGGLFWSRHARSQMEIQFPCTATMQEYMRTFSITEPIYVAMTPLAVWAENAEQTTRNAELKASYLRRELDLKRSIQILQRLVWKSSPREYRRAFLADPSFMPGPEQRSRALAKALILHGLPVAGARKSIELTLRGVAIRALGQVPPEFGGFIASRSASQRPAPSGVH